MTTILETSMIEERTSTVATTPAERLDAARSLAHRLLAEFGLTDWRFEFMSRRAVRRFGDCNHTKKTIRLSPVLTEMNDASEVEDTLRHEIAHALCHPSDGHNRRFYAMCQKVGATPTRCYDQSVNAPPRKPKAPSYRRRCPGCERTWYYRGPISALRACGQCGIHVLIESRCDAGWEPKGRRSIFFRSTTPK